MGEYSVVMPDSYTQHSLCARLHALRQTQQLNDCKVIFVSSPTATHVVPYNAFFLSLVSEFFESAFTSGMRETTEREVRLYDATHIQMEMLLDLVCGQTIHYSEPQTPLELFLLADQWHMQGVCNVLARACFDRVNVETCCAWLQALHGTVSLPRVRDEALKVALANFEQVRTATTTESNARLLQVLLPSQMLAVSEEDVVLDTILRLQPRFRDALLPHVRFGLLRRPLEWWRRMTPHEKEMVQTCPCPWTARKGMDVAWHMFLSRIDSPAAVGPPISALCCSSYASLWTAHENGTCREWSDKSLLRSAPLFPGQYVTHMKVLGDKLVCGYNSGHLRLLFPAGEVVQLTDTYVSHVALWVTPQRTYILCSAKDVYSMFDEHGEFITNIRRGRHDHRRLVALTVWKDYLLTMSEDSVHAYHLHEPLSDPVGIGVCFLGSWNDMAVHGRSLFAVNSRAEIREWELGTWNLRDGRPFIPPSSNNEAAEYKLAVNGSMLLCGGWDGTQGVMYVFDMEHLWDGTQSMTVHARFNCTRRLRHLLSQSSGYVWAVVGDIDLCRWKHSSRSWSS